MRNNEKVSIVRKETKERGYRGKMRMMRRRVSVEGTGSAWEEIMRDFLGTGEDEGVVVGSGEERQVGGGEGLGTE